MPVKDTLDKIVERHPDVIGAMVMHNGAVQHNLDAPYDIVAVDVILETFSEVFEQTSMLADEGYEFSELIMDLADHSFIVRTFDGGILAVLAPSLQRGQLVKLHVGLGLFGKAIEKAIQDQAASFVDTAPITPSVQQTAEPQQAAVPDSAPVETAPLQDAEPNIADESSLGQGFGRRRGGFRGTKEMIASRLDRAHDAVDQPAPKTDDVPDDGIPRHPDGTPKKMRKYRGQIFWE